ncbi:MAG: hypothetical protein GY719_13000 [bacterium]|nr:hypothetical protein [bacterium]
MSQAEKLASYARDPRADDDEITFKQFEQSIIRRVFDIGCTAVALFLTCCETRIRARTPRWLVQGGRSFERKSPTDRSIMTWFGSVRYWRTYMLERDAPKGGHGFFPLEHELGLTSDRFGFNMLAVVVRLATTLSFATAKSTAEIFLPEVPATEVIEQTTLGFGRFTSKWFESAPAPDDDGDVLVILFDGKGTPQATEEELELRRQPWKDRPRASSPRHRGRQNRGQRPKKKRPKPDDKSKNARMATMIVMYTLRTVGTELHGPINKWHYASFAPKKHAFAIAFREAKKRGFDPDGDDVIQIVTDGDPDLARYTKLFFPKAIHTLDVIHVVERLWKASTCFYEAGSEAQENWVEEQKDLLYAGRIEEVITELRARRNKLCRSNKNEKRRERLKKLIDYLKTRVHMMNYAELVDEDLEIGSGAVEGAVKHIIGKRCDQGGMRWIVERNEAVVQLRCIEVNGDWERFTSFVHDRIRGRQLEDLSRIRIQQKVAEPLPKLVNRPKCKDAA